MLDDILLQVNKPSRYLGNEWNVIKKDFDNAYIKIALCFPDIYEVGMSNFGMRILYGVLNDISDVVCERVFHPALDMELLMRSRPLKLFTLESQRKLTDFDIIGFSLGYELNYTNMLNILIPHKSRALLGISFCRHFADKLFITNKEWQNS